MSLEHFGRYQLLKKIATGGMAQIFLARQEGPEGFEKLLVLKRILPHLAENEDFVRMFLDEARIAARLNHPNVVQIFDLGAQDDTYFIAMEYIHGEDLRRVSKRGASTHQSIPVPLVLRIIIEACAGLDYAHKKTDANGRPLNIVHRDISPQNILVTFEGGVKVVDFGIANAADKATHTQSGVLKGKYAYMAPEQAAGHKVDRQADVFALGVILYELLTDTRLFKRANDIQTLNAVSECDVTPPSQVNPRVPADLDEWVLRALAKNVEDRYSDCAEMQGALDAWLLDHGQGASTLQLKAYMQHLFADRLAREADEGNVVVEAAELSREAPEEPPQPKQVTQSLRPSAVSKSKPARRDPAVVTQASQTIQDRSLSVLVGATLLFALAGAVVAYAFRDNSPEPQGAVVGAVPATLLPVADGDAGGVVAQELAAPMALVRLDTRPSGAEIVVDGRKLGVTPLEFEAAPTAGLEGAAELVGHRRKPFSLTLDGGLRHEFIFDLEALERREHREPGRAMGALRVVVSPWATVTCGDYRLGDTPFPDKQLPAGRYHCTFVNPDFAKESRDVEVKANTTTKVAVKLKP